MAGTLFLVSTPIGNLDDMTYRAVEVLGSVDTVLAEDTRRTRILLDHYRIAVDSLLSYHEHNEAARTQEMRTALAAGASVALVSDSGTPLISDPGLRLVRAALEVGARVVPIPGPSAVLGALVASGLDPQPFSFFGFVPRSGRERTALAASLARLPHTAVLYESPQRLVRTLEWLAEMLGAERPAVVARELTKIHEEFRAGTLAGLAGHYRQHAPRGEVVICLAGASLDADYGEEEIRAAARNLAADGASTREIVQTLRDRFGLERNRAYEIALQSGEEAGT
ncbi:MAG: 16S rRNA (cytidine(1402)-2'-O)-methyltransferase [Gemmatimonadetes bacterium]|uniref:Ribosomal RNA small subunit methyltransferase I n=1 Tax=Candidatus Kutchimonas denitrificans TaxID=3056748 RepID=A0AAE4Z995_9BACT|nr:16S rRNA (cytidine(1402)-2'-O)-methyltransferase [Gemmatimonadota bacterium]NIR76179.1 16S rRNA (cytidine(1402)-2'-O)-methyltransferase [Candidatus Kutchimonas denitrificans]NIS00619.1 16S rRNA (cytidine(1402)-2'-O)-methyltransferase [Gemmatimonadota bacterium]NIT66764.1 16S rRNA (cytidine(1402)-2'-O)-methyltransferase [Gemmatimonadota bacterium]NIV23363.1 16S rRNA (cytidine(1402)-2'-O)-methyltransferase [Gemmatimonadota bacterium]